MKRILPLLILATMVACKGYEKEIDKYRAERVANLKRDYGWLSVVALLPLQEGANDVALPSNPPKHAQIHRRRGRVPLDPDASFTIDNKPVTAPAELHNDTEDAGYTTVHYGKIAFFIHKVGDKFGMRVKDPDSDRRKNFKGLQYFPTDRKYRVEARFDPYNPPKHIQMPNRSEERRVGKECRSRWSPYH